MGLAAVIPALGGIRGTLFAGTAVAAIITATVFRIQLGEARSAATKAGEKAAEASALALAHKNNATAWQLDALQARLDLSQCQGQWATAQQTLEDQRRAAAESRAVSQREIAKWRDRWNSRPQACSALLKELDTACASLSDY